MYSHGPRVFEQQETIVRILCRRLSSLCPNDAALWNLGERKPKDHFLVLLVEMLLGHRGLVAILVLLRTEQFLWSCHVDYTFR